MYQAIFCDKKNGVTHLWDDKTGYSSFPTIRYAYRKMPGGSYRSLYGDELEKVTAFDERDPSLFESDVDPSMRALIDLYPNEDEPSKGHKVVVIDIEVSSEGGFPDITKGDKAVTAIAIFDQAANKYYSLVLDPDSKISNSSTPELETLSFKCEDTLLDSFLHLWEQIQPTIASGWNCIPITQSIWLKNKIVKLGELKDDDLYASTLIKKSPISVKELWSIELVNGKKIFCSGNHKFPIRLVNPDEYTTLTETKKSNFVDADLNARQIRSFHDCMDVYCSIELRKNDNVDQNYSLSQLYLAGLIYTDGSLKDKKHITNGYTFYQSDKNLMKKLDELGVDSSLVGPYKNCYSRHIKQSLIGDAHALIYDGNSKKLNLERLSTLSYIQFMSFLSGLLDGDGCNSGGIAWCNYNNDVDTLHELCNWNGIFCTQQKHLLRFIDINRTDLKLLKHKRWSECYESTLQRKSKQKSNQIRFKKIGNQYLVKVKNVEYDGTSTRMMDIETDTHYFVSKGVKTHNCNGFDFPYLYNRIKTVLGKQSSYRLSPIGIAYQNKFTNRMVIAGISLLDYMELYKKFVGVMKPSWSLGNVAKDEELKNQKLTYRGSLTQLYKEDLHRYVEYNLVDVKVVVELDKKYDFIHLAQAVCHKGHVPYEWFQMSSRFIDGAILTYLKRKGQVAPNKPIGGREEYEDMQDNGEDGFTGAFVKEPISGLYDWICSADIRSLYPSVIMTLNISPETKVSKIEGWNMLSFQRDEMPVVRLADKSFTAGDFKKMIADYKLGISSNGVIYRQDIRGVVPTILDAWFKERIDYRKKAAEFGKAGDKEQEAFYDRRQKRQKIFLNCFSPDTKIMTKSGVKYINEVKVGDLVYSLNVKTGESELKPVTRTYDYDYEGDMVHFESNHIDFLITPNHKFWVSKLGKKKYKPFSWEDAGNVIGDKVRRKFPPIKPLPHSDNPPDESERIDLAYYARLYGMDYVLRGTHEDEIRIKRDADDKQGRHTTFIPRWYKIGDWIEFMGWYISEGSLYTTISKEYANGNHRGVTHKIHIAQEVYHKEVKELLEKMKLPFYEDVRGFSISNDIIYKFLESNCGKSSENKKIPEWLFQSHPDKQRRLYKSLMMGDGHKRGNCYTTKSKELKDGFIRLCFHIGDVYAFVRNYDGCYRIQINKLRGKGPTLKVNHRKLLPYKGKVYCVEVQDNHTVLCGRNDKYQWCGQSVYGTLGLPIFRFYDRDNAEAVTISGQEIIRSAEKLVNDTYLTKFKEAGVEPPSQDFVVYIDTDSLYMSAAPVAKLAKVPPEEMVKFTIDWVTSLATRINRFYEFMVPKIFNVAPKYNHIEIVADVVAKKALWVVKKRYAMLKVFDMEKMKPVKSKDGREGKLEVKGIDVVRSSFPKSFQKFASNILDDLLRGTSKTELDGRIMSFEETIQKIPMVDLAKTSSVRFVSRDGETNYAPSTRRLFQFIMKTPAQVRAALAYNDLLKIWKLDKKFEKITHSEKVKWVYTLPNSFCIEAIAFKGDDTDPDEILNFISENIDRNKMYQRELRSKLEDIWTAINWQYPNRGSELASQTFNFEETW